MSITKATVFNLRFRDQNLLEKFLVLSNQNKLALAFLDPKELPEDWGEVKTLQNSSLDNATLNNNILKLEESLAISKPKGFLNNFLEERVEVNLENFAALDNNQSEILETSNLYLEYSKNIKFLQEVSKITQKNQGKYYLLKNLEVDLQGLIDAYITKTQSLLPAELQEEGVGQPKIKTFELGGYQVVVSNQNLPAEIFEQAGLMGLGEYVEQVLTRSQEVEAQLNIIDGKADSEIRKQWLLLKACLEFQTKSQEIRGKCFQVNNTDSVYSFVSVSNKNLQAFQDLLSDLQVYYEEVDWVEDLIIWNNNTILTPFQKLLEPIGGVRLSEADPSGVVSISYVVFFAFCLGDALYGLVIALITSFLLIQKNLKSSLRGILTLFNLSAWVTVLYGIITNSWAGDGFSFINLGGQNLGETLSNVQLINYLDPEAQVPLNIFLRENGNINPIVFSLGVAILIGLLHIFTAYSFKMLNSLKAKNTSDFINTLVWVLFLLSLLGLPLWLGVSSLTNFGLGLVGLLLVLNLIFNEGEGFGGKLMAILIDKFFGLISFFSESMSYTRLIAVGLTSGIVASVVNLIAELLFQAGNSLGGAAGLVLGLFLAIAMLLVGHIFNLVVAIFGAYINPLRLHYVEFLPKFYEGKGRLMEVDTKAFEQVDFVS